jgi:RNA polymerase sigma factor (sigma-70 family)
MVRDVGLAEELAQDALVAALEQWPVSGIPERPGAWLMGTAKHRAIDMLRRSKRLQEKTALLGRELEVQQEIGEPDLDAAIDESHIADDLLRLMFTACHPLLSTDARVALTLRMLGGLTTDEIAHAFLVPEPTIAQRIVRAKRTLAEARVPFEVPGAAELRERLASVLEVIYLIFNEGYSASAGDDWTRPALCEDALRLGRVLAELVPDESEVHGLVALMEIQSSRLRARIGPSGEPVLLMDQNRALWDQLLIRRGLAELARAEALEVRPTSPFSAQDAGGRTSVTDALGRRQARSTLSSRFSAAFLGDALGPYALQAAIAACHARARTPDETDWARIAALYATLTQLEPSPVIELNRAVAVAMAFGPAAGLEIVDALVHEASLKAYHLLPTVRGDLLVRLGRLDEARQEFERAAALTRNARQREFLLGRAAACSDPTRS